MTGPHDPTAGPPGADGDPTWDDRPPDHSHDDQTFGTPHSHPDKSLWRPRPIAVISTVFLLIVATILFNSNATRQPSGQQRGRIALNGQQCSVDVPPVTTGRCYGSFAPSAAPTPTPTVVPTPTPSPTPTPAVLKSPLQGLITRGGTPAYDWMLGQVAQVSWADLQSGAGMPITANNKLDQAIASVRAWNASHPTAIRGIKLRTGAAGGAPASVKSIGGAPLAVADKQNGASATVGRFWTAPYLAAYADLQTKLAAKYDGVPELREVTWAEPALVYEEPFQRYSQTTLAAAGWTVALDEAAFTQSLTAHQAWHTTLQDIAFNPSPQDPPFMASFLASARALLGRQLVLGNNSLRSSSPGALYGSMYATIQAAGAPIYFQTATIARWGDPATTFALAAAYGAGCVEVPDGYTTVPQSVLTTAQASLLANPA